MPFQSEKQRKYLWANEPEIARDWTDKYGSRVKKDNGGITRIPFANGSNWTNQGNWTNPGQYKQDMLNQYQDIASRYGTGENYTSSPIFTAGFEKWDPYGMGSGIGKAVHGLKGMFNLGASAVAAPFGSGLYVPKV